LDQKSSRPLREQLIGQLRSLVLHGTLAPGSRLPPSRALARDLGISRKLAVLAYEQLQAEGYLETREGSGTRVKETLPAHLLATGGVAAGVRPGQTEAAGSQPEPAAPPRLSRQGVCLAGARGVPVRVRGRPGPFVPGTTVPEDFPVRIWTRLSAELWRSRAAELVPYGEAAGYYPLRKAIARHVGRFRGVRCTEAQIVFSTGSQQALDLVARMLVDPGDRVGIEEPGYRGARMAFGAAGAQLVPLPVDGDGVVFPPPPELEEEASDIRLVYTTPSHQYPLGVTLTLGRRLRLLEWARDQGTWIVEDDYDASSGIPPVHSPPCKGWIPPGGCCTWGRSARFWPRG